MQIKEPVQACRVVRKITDHGVFLCLKPADVMLSLNLPDFVFICSDCARGLAREIRNSLPGAPPRGRSFQQQREALARQNGGKR